MVHLCIAPFRSPGAGPALQPGASRGDVRHGDARQGEMRGDPGGILHHVGWLEA